MKKQDLNLIEMIDSHNVTVFSSAQRAIKALSALFRYGELVRRPEENIN